MDELRREYAQSWRESDVELGIKKPKRPTVSASAAAAAMALENTSGAIGACSLKKSKQDTFSFHDLHAVVINIFRCVVLSFFFELVWIFHC